MASELVAAQLFLAELATRDCYLLCLPDWSPGMSTLGKADGTAISAKVGLLYN